MTQELAEQLPPSQPTRDPYMDAEMLAAFYDKLKEKNLPDPLIHDLCIAYLVRR